MPILNRQIGAGRKRKDGRLHARPIIFHGVIEHIAEEEITFDVSEW
jgi:hypothetical protein